MEKVEMYKSFDGKLFDTEKDCEKYEASNKLYFEAYDKYGKKTNIPFDMIYVHIENMAGIRNFINICNANNSAWDGVQLDLPGWYVFHPTYHKYIYYADWMLEHLKILIDISKNS